MLRTFPLASLLRLPAFRFGLLFFLSALLLFANLHRGDLAGYDDAVYAHEGKQMLLRGDWWNVWLNGKLDFDKPPLFIWLEAASFWLLGVNDFAAKFPAALLGLATIVLVHQLARQLTANEWLPALAMLVMATTQYFVKYATHSMTDVPFTFFFTLALWAYGQGLQKSRAYWVLCGLAIALAALTRSHLGWLPLLICGAHLWLTQPRTVWRAPALWIGLSVALALPLAWFGLQLYWHGEAFLAHHFAYTFENARSIEAARGWRVMTGLAHYPFLLGKLYWPWLPCLLGGLWLAAKQLRSNQFTAINREALWLLVLWIAITIAPFSLIQHKVLRYILPAFPAFALLAAFALQHWIPDRFKLRAFGTACALLLAGILFITFTASHRLRALDMRQLAAALEADKESDYPVLLFDGGQARWDYLHQFIWYSDRTCRLQTRLDIVLCHLDTCPSRTALLDRNTFQKLSGTSFSVCGESVNFVCVRRANSPEAELNRVAALDMTTNTHE